MTASIQKQTIQNATQYVVTTSVEGIGDQINNYDTLTEAIDAVTNYFAC